jgi:hypothetical protein
MDDAPLFEVTTATASAAARRLTTAARVNAALRKDAANEATLIESIIDTVSAECARHCALARATGGAVPTFGQEVVKATWLATCLDRGAYLRLPWRVPITAIDSVVECGSTLVANTDFRLVAGAMLERMCSDTPICWSHGKIVVAYTAGWSLPTNVPAEIEGQVIEQVKMRYLGTARDYALRQESTEGVGSAAYSVPGGDSIAKDGLISPLQAALSAFCLEEV